MNFCPECGEKIRKNAVKCPKCGKNLKEETKKNTKVATKKTSDRKGLVIASLVIGIISLVLSPLFTVLIMPLAILGLVFGIVGKKPKGKKIAGIITNSIAILLSIIALIIWVVILSNVSNFEDSSFGKLYKELFTEKIEGTWNCKTSNYYNSNYVLTLKMKDNNKFYWTDYKNSSKSYVKGNYDFSKVEDNDYYKMKLYPKTMYLYGVKRSTKSVTSYKVYFEKVSSPKKIKLVNTSTYNTYYCDEK